MAKKAPARKAASGARKKAGGRSRGMAPRRAGAARKKVASRKKKAATRGGRKSAGASRKTARKAIRKAKSVKPVKSAKPVKVVRSARAASKSKTKPKAKRPRLGGNGDERTLAQTPETGRSVRGRTNPMNTRRSTGTPAGAGGIRLAPGLDRARRQLREVEESLPGPPSSLDLDQSASAARSGRRELEQSRREHTETSPVMTAGDVDADWEDAYAVGDEAPGGDNPTPDQDRVDDIGKALGVEYEDSEELKAADKITERDRHRWELDPASAEDYTDRD
jgi:Family of unknown function (DUF6335)